MGKAVDSEVHCFFYGQLAFLHKFIIDISTFEPPASSTHLSDLHTILSQFDSFVVLPDVDSTAISPDADSTTTSLHSNSITMLSDSGNSSMPSFGPTDFDIDEESLPSFDLPEYSSEESFDDSLPQGAIAHDPPQLEYFTIPDASIHERAKLVESQGYSYTVKRTTITAIHWRCSQQNPKSIDCKATSS